MDQQIPVVIRDVPEMRGVFSRVHVGSEISRSEMLLMALMSSENRAAASLAENYPGGVPAFVAAMNAKAGARPGQLTSTHYVEPTGLSEKNVSSASDLVKLLKATQQYPQIGQFSTTREHTAAFRVRRAANSGFSQHQPPGVQERLEHPDHQELALPMKPAIVW